MDEKEKWKFVKVRAGGIVDKETKIRIFESTFFDDVESWFSRDIACCESCYAEYLAMWPYAYSADDAKFQCDSIPLSAFYSGSRHLQDMFTEDEFWEYLPYVRCPNCGESLKSWIWPYELPFTPPTNYECLIEELADIANKTPFLLLSHSFSLQIFDAIKGLAGEVHRQHFKDRLFRGRNIDSAVVTTLTDFDFPPKEVVRDGRYNHAGDSVLYLASTEKVCKAEMRNSPALRIASFDYNSDLKILDLMSPHEAEHKFSELLSFISFSALLSSQSHDEGFHRPEYVFSRFVKDCAVYSGFDAIKYPSTRVGTAQYNLVIVNPALSLAECATDFHVPLN